MLNGNNRRYFYQPVFAKILPLTLPNQSGKRMKNTWTLTCLLLMSAFIYACSVEEYKCEGFNFERLPYDSTYFFKDLYYTNGFDTIKLTKVKSTFDTASICQIGYLAPPREPEFSFEMKDREHIGRLEINYSFHYDPEIPSKLNLYIHFISSGLNLSIDTLQLNAVTRIYFDKSHNPQQGSTWKEIAENGDKIKSIELKKMRLITIEKYSGEKWRLIKENNPADN